MPCFLGLQKLISYPLYLATSQHQTPSLESKGCDHHLSCSQTFSNSQVPRGQIQTLGLTCQVLRDWAEFSSPRFPSSLCVLIYLTRWTTCFLSILRAGVRPGTQSHTALRDVLLENTVFYVWYKYRIMVSPPPSLRATESWACIACATQPTDRHRSWDI